MNHLLTAVRLTAAALFMSAAAAPVLAENIGTIQGPGLQIAWPSYVVYATNSRGNMGYAIGFGSESEARAAAMNGCGQSNCQIVMVADAECGAFTESTQGGYWLGFAYGDNLNEVRRIAMEGCAQGAPVGTCVFRHSGCS
jgi:hypothetical protein